MKLNDALPRIHVDAETYVVTADGEELRAKPARRAAAGAAVLPVLRADARMSELADWLTWQLVDSAFPTGAFAHSWGLEAAWQQGEVDEPRRAAAVPATRRSCRPGTGRCRCVNAAYRDAGALDDARRAGRRVPDQRRRQPRQPRPGPDAGRDRGARLAVGRAGRRSSARAERDVRARRAAVGRASSRALGLPLATAQRVVLFGTARGVLSAAVRLGHRRQLRGAAAAARVRAVARRASRDAAAL